MAGGVEEGQRVCYYLKEVNTGPKAEWRSRGEMGRKRGKRVANWERRRLVVRGSSAV